MFSAAFSCYRCFLVLSVCLAGMLRAWAAAPLSQWSMDTDLKPPQHSQHLRSAIVGWHWYNEPLKKKKSDRLPTDNNAEKREKAEKNRRMTEKQALSSDAWVTAFHQLPPLQQLRLLQAVTAERRVKAVLSGKVEDIAAYKAAQDFWVRRATAFTVGWEQMLLRYPDRDYSLTYSHQNFLAPIMQNTRHQAENRAIATLRKNHGLLFFYRGGMPEDRLFSGIVHRFAEKYHFSVMPVSVDGQTTRDFPESRQDTQQKKAAAVGVRFVPALVLVNPAQQRTQIVSYGAQSESDLAARLWRLANHWQPGF